MTHQFQHYFWNPVSNEIKKRHNKVFIRHENQLCPWNTVSTKDENQSNPDSKPPPLGFRTWWMTLSKSCGGALRQSIERKRHVTREMRLRQLRQLRHSESSLKMWVCSEVEIYYIYILIYIVTSIVHYISIYTVHTIRMFVLFQWVSTAVSQ